MSDFKQASRVGLRFQTNRGNLTTEQLWELSLTDLDTLAVHLETEVEQSSKKSFLLKKTEKSKTAKLKFDIVIDILTTLVEEKEAASKQKETKEHNQKILNLIANKQEQDLQGKSVEELTAMLK